jgi:hypothetical protein
MLAPDWMVAEDSFFFWFSYLPPLEGSGVMISGAPVLSLVTGRPHFGLSDKILPTLPADYSECVRYLVKQPVVWCSYSGSEFLLGPAERWMSWDSLLEISGDPKCVVRPIVLDDRYSVPCWVSYCPQWTPVVLLTGELIFASVPPSVVDPLPSSPPLSGSYNELCHWVHSKDDKFGFRLGVGRPENVYLCPNQLEGDVVVDSQEEISATSPTTGVAAPSAGLVATLAGGALGLGYSVTKLLR